jgi:hypothetical protein
MAMVIVPIHVHAAPPLPCRIGEIRGATSAQGAVANVTMTNTGATCRIPNYGIPALRANPADTGRITKPPRNGTAAFDPPDATYVPNRGFAGEDEFEYEASAKGADERVVQLRVTVKLTVTRP